MIFPLIKMFKFLKDKLKGWTEKISKEAEAVEIEKPKAKKSEKKTKDKSEKKSENDGADRIPGKVNAGIKHDDSF